MKGSNLILLLWSVMLVFALAISTTNTTTEPTKYYQEKQEAAALTEKAYNAIKEYKLSLGIPMSKEDIHQTGLIGERYTPITTTLGIVESKRTSVNPNFAAVIIDMFEEAGIKKQDEIVLTFSGSFPALNIAAMAAVEVMELKPLIMASIGASSYGANVQGITYVHMSTHLYENNIFSHQIDYLSLGGANDVGSEFDEELKQELINYIHSTEIPFIYEEDFKSNIDYRVGLIEKKVPNYKMLINVGGNLVSLGQNESSLYGKNGLIMPKFSHRPLFKNEDSGLVQYALDNGKAIVQFLNIKSLAFTYELPYDSKTSIEAGKGSVYYGKKVGLLIPSISIGLSVLIGAFYFLNYKGEEKSG